MFSATYLRQLLHYDPKTGSFTWLEKRNGVKPSQEAGCAEHGYKKIKIDGRKYHASILAWIYITGEWPLATIDHKDGDPWNNAWDNLRLATASQNGVNAPRYKNNKSGYKGVSWSKSAKKYHAQLKKNNRRIHLGYFEDPKEAHAAYARAAKFYHREFARTQ